MRGPANGVSCDLHWMNGLEAQKEAGMAHAVTTETTVTIGLDLGDRQTAGCVVAEGGQMLERFEARTPARRTDRQEI